MADISIWDRIRVAIAAFRQSGGLDLPSGGRSSSEESGKGLGGALRKYSAISPVVDFEMLECLQKFWIFNPDVAQFVSNIQNLANPGHEVVIDSASEQSAERAMERLNETASRIYKNAAGVDGLINAYLAQIAWSGALSSEDIVSFGAKRVEQTVIVPVLKIRFKFDEDLQEYRPYQRSTDFRKGRDNLGLIPLHPATYRYYALQTIENSPYAKPPASAAIEAITNTQTPILENLQYIAQKFGLLGLVTASVINPPKKPNETDGEFQTRAKTYLDRIRKVLEQGMSKGLLVTFRDQKIEHTDVSSGARGVYDLNRISEEQIMSGLGMQPAFFGRTDSTTETYADVVYNLLLAQIANIQRLPKRRLEQTYRLDFRLGGIEVDSVSIQFNKTYSRNRIQESQASETEVRTILEKARAGIISPDEAAQELGYESAYDPELLNGNASLAAGLRIPTRADKGPQSFAFRFDKDSQRYRFLPAQINIAGDELSPKAENILAFEKKKKAQLN